MRPPDGEKYFSARYKALEKYALWSRYATYLLLFYDQECRHYSCRQFTNFFVFSTRGLFFLCFRCLDCDVKRFDTSNFFNSLLMEKKILTQNLIHFEIIRTYWHIELYCWRLMSTFV